MRRQRDANVHLLVFHFILKHDTNFNELSIRSRNEPTKSLYFIYSPIKKKIVLINNSNLFYLKKKKKESGLLNKMKIILYTKFQSK